MLPHKARQTQHAQPSGQTLSKGSTVMTPEKPSSRTRAETESGSPSAPTVVQEKFAKSYDDLMQALYCAWNSEEDAREWREAMEAMQKAFSEYASPSQVAERTQAYAEYLRKVRAAMDPEKVQSRIDTAFQQYMTAVSTLWSELDAKTKPETLSRIGQSIAWAGYYASFKPIAQPYIQRTTRAGG